MNSKRIINLQDPSRNDEPVTKKYGDTNYKGLTANGFTMKDNISMGGHRITNLADPAMNNEPVIKGYADTHYSGGTGPQGPQGPKGDIGNRGPKGDQGDLGHQGSQGEPQLARPEQEEHEVFKVQRGIPVNADQLVQPNFWWNSVDRR